MTDALTGYRDTIKLSDLAGTVKAFRRDILDNHLGWMTDLEMFDSDPRNGDGTLEGKTKMELERRVAHLTSTASSLRQITHSDANDDKIAPFGEWMAIEVIAAYLRKRLPLHDLGYNTVLPKTAKDIGILTDNEYGNANILVNQCGSWVRGSINSARKANQLLVVSGFDGVYRAGDTRDSDMYTTTLGRSGSDTTAFFIGEALAKAKPRESGYGPVRVVLLKETPGVMSGNPKIIPSAQPLSYIDYEIAVNAGNIHSKAVNHARETEFEAHILDPSVRDQVTVVGSEPVQEGVYLVLDPQEVYFINISGVSSGRHPSTLFGQYGEKGLKYIHSYSAGDHIEAVVSGKQALVDEMKVTMREHGIHAEVTPAHYCKLVGNITPEHRDDFNGFVRQFNPLMDSYQLNGSKSLTCVLPQDVDANKFSRQAHDLFVN